MLFGTECCETFIEEDVFIDDKVGAYITCEERNKSVIMSMLTKLHELYT